MRAKLRRYTVHGTVQYITVYLYKRSHSSTLILNIMMGIGNPRLHQGAELLFPRRIASPLSGTSVSPCYIPTLRPRDGERSWFRRRASVSCTAPRTPRTPTRRACAALQRSPLPTAAFERTAAPFDAKISRASARCGACQFKTPPRAKLTVQPVNQFKTPRG